MEKNVLGNRVRNARKELRLTQEQFAKIANMTRSTIRDIETGKNKCTNLDMINKLVKATGKPVDYFLDDKIEINLGIYDAIDDIFTRMIEKGIKFEDVPQDQMMELLELTFNLKKERLNK